MTQTPHRDAADLDPPVNELAERLRPFWSAGKVAAELNLTESGLLELVECGGVLALETADPEPSLVFPVAQFERAAAGVRMRPGVRAMLSQLQGEDRWTVALLLTTPAPELNGLTPYQAAKGGADGEQLAAFARLVRAEWR